MTNENEQGVFKCLPASFAYEIDPAILKLFSAKF